MLSTNSSNLIKFKNYISGLNRIHFIHGDWSIMHTVWRVYINICQLTLKVEFDDVTLVIC